MTVFRSVLICAMVLIPSYASAQVGLTAGIPLPFDFLNPGARSLGLGGAFIAVADDATAALANPAGLTLLARPEVSAELRFRTLRTPYLDSGRLSGTVTNNGLDTINGPSYARSSDSALRANFLSVVYPWKRLSFSGYRHELVSQDNSFVATGAFYAIPLSGGQTANDARQQGTAADRTVRIDNYGVSAGYRLHERLSVGAGVSFYFFDLEANFGNLSFVSDTFSPVNLDSRGSLNTTIQDGSMTQVAVNIGVLATLSNAVRAGFTFRQGTSFDYEQVVTVPGLPTIRQIGRFQTPTVIGGGIRLRPGSQWSFAVDYSRVQYSRLITDYVDFQLNPTVVTRMSLPDSNEMHFGGEYAFAGARFTPAIRGGIWYDPDHALRYASDGSNSAEDVQYKAVLNRGESVLHYSGGVGLSLSRSFEFNAGVDFTKNRSYASASIVARFGN